MTIFVGRKGCANEKGQVLLIVVLVMVVALTVGLGVASRSITNLRVTSEEASSQKAFFAAESGIEEVLKTGATPVIAESLGNNATLQKVTVTQLSALTDPKNILVSSDNQIPQDEGIDVWLTNYNTNSANLYKSPYWNGTITFYWGKSTDICALSAANNTMAAIEIIVISGNPDKNSPKTARFGFDPCAGRIAYNNFSAVAVGNYAIATTNGTKNFAFKAIIPAVANGLIARVIPLYAPTTMWVQGSSNFPSQGKIITAIGASGRTTRQISYFQGYDAVPSEFFFSLFSPK